jgi:hypothetical protein
LGRNLGAAYWLAAIVIALGVIAIGIVFLLMFSEATN